MMIIALLVVLSVSGMIYWAYTEDNISVPDIVQLNLFKEDISCNIAGDCISFFIPDVPESNTTVPVDYTIDENMESQKVKEIELQPNNIINGTSVNTIDPDESSISGEITDTSITRQGELVQDYSYLGDHMRVQIGNVAVITGNIKILDPITKQIVEPQIYKYIITIECSVIEQSCNLTPLSIRGITETDGKFIYKWTTNIQQHRALLYDVSIHATSESVDENNRKLSVNHTMFLELFS